MSFAGEVWSKLSKIDVNEHTETKGNGNFKLTYLSWTWAWATLMDHYPESEYQFSDDTVYEDGTVEVSVTVTVREDDKSLSRYLWLPVMDHKNASVVRPTSRQRSDARMRCLVKCLAMFGLGHYIYAGEDMPSAEKDQAEKKAAYTPEQKAIFDEAIATGDGMLLVALMRQSSEQAQAELHNSFEGGAKSSGKETVRELTRSGDESWDSLVADVLGMIQSEDAGGLYETVSELSTTEKRYLARRIGDKQAQIMGGLVKSIRDAA